MADRGLTVEEAAAAMEVDRAELERVVEERAAITPDFALKLEAMGWASADMWMRRQARYDLAAARKRAELARRAG